MDKVRQAVDELYKSHFGRIVASLLYASSSIDPQTAEDLVQDSFASALTHWRQKGIYLLNSALGKLYHLEGNDSLAKQFLEKAYAQTHLAKERDFIRKMLERVNKE